MIFIVISIVYFVDNVATGDIINIVKRPQVIGSVVTTVY